MVKENTKCAYCGKPLYRQRLSKNSFCNASHQMKYEYANGIRDKNKIALKANEFLRRKGLEKFKNNPTTYIGKRGYKMIYVPLVGWKKYHHYVWEKVNGPVPLGMVLHHKNFDRLDNSLNNLVLMDSKEHGKLHYAKRVIDKLGRFC
jgi:hypothetical protein